MNLFNLFALLTYILLLFIGGIIGFVKTGSYVSILTATAFTIVLLISMWATRVKYNWGVPLTWACLILLTAFFGYRLAVTGAIMPAGLMLSLGILTMGCLFYKGKNQWAKDT